MGKIKVSALLALFETMVEERWAYEYGAARKGEVDCSGAFVYAAEQLGREDILHSSNRIARINCKEMLPISNARPGYAAFKWRKDFETAELEEKYGDNLGNFKHIGLVSRDGKYVLHAKGEAYGFVCTELDSSWQYVAELDFVEYTDDSQLEVDMESVIYHASVATKKDPLRVRDWPKTGEILGHVDKGSIVDVLRDNGDGWPFIRYNELIGYASAEYLTPVLQTDGVADAADRIVIRDSAGNEFRPVGGWRVEIGAND